MFKREINSSISLEGPANKEVPVSIAIPHCPFIFIKEEQISINLSLIY